MKTISGSIFGCMLAACVYSSTVAAQESQGDLPKPAPVKENGVTYMSGGIGDSEAKEMKSASKNYDLKLTFVTKEQGAYLSDVKVDIQDAKGNNMVSTVSQGPIFLANLPAGKYRVTAEAEGKAFTKQIHVNGRQQVQTAFQWPQKLVASPAPAPQPETTVSESTTTPLNDSTNNAAPMNAAPTQ